jgi:hypothetical protein
MQLVNIINNRNILIIFSITLLISFFFQNKIYLEFETQSDKNIRSQIYIDHGNGISEKKSKNFWIKKGSQKHKIRLDDLNNKILSIRFDPESSNKKFDLRVKEIILSTNDNVIKDKFKIFNIKNLDISNFSNDHHIKKSNLLDDPYFWISIDWKKNTFKVFIDFFLSIILISLTFYFIFLSIKRYDFSYLKIDLIIFLFLFFVVFYISNKSLNFFDLNIWTDFKNKISTGSDFYYSLAYSFLDSRTNMDKPVDPKLFNLLSPYKEYFLIKADVVYDLSFYNNKYYSYWPPLGSLFLSFVSIIFGKFIFLGDKILALIGVFFYTLSLRLLISKIFSHNYLIILATLTVITNIIFIFTFKQLTLPEHGIYQSSVLFAGIFLNLALYYLLFGDYKNNILLISLFISFIFFSRVSLAPVSIAIYLIYLFKFNQDKIFNHQNILKLTIIPLLLGLLLLFYNYVRFENFLEFGHSYQIGSYVSRLEDGINKFSIKNYLFNFYTYILKYPAIDFEFPYLNFNDILNDPIAIKFFENLINKINIPLLISCNEPLIGIIWHFPIILITFFYFSDLNKIKKKQIIFLFLLLLISSIPLFSVFFRNIRYGVDYFIFIFVISFLVLKNTFKTKIITIIFILSLALNLNYVDMITNKYSKTTKSKIYNLKGHTFEKIKFKCHL